MKSVNSSLGTYTEWRFRLKNWFLNSLLLTHLIVGYIMSPGFRFSEFEIIKNHCRILMSFASLLSVRTNLIIFVFDYNQAIFKSNYSKNFFKYIVHKAWKGSVNASYNRRTEKTMLRILLYTRNSLITQISRKQFYLSPIIANISFSGDQNRYSFKWKKNINDMHIFFIQFETFFFLHKITLSRCSLNDAHIFRENTKKRNSFFGEKVVKIKIKWTLTTIFKFQWMDIG